MNPWAWLFGKKEKVEAPVAPAPVAFAKRKSTMGLDQAIALLQAEEKEKAQPITVFAMPSHPPSVYGADKDKQPMAMDDALVATNTWANSFGINGFMSEGITFLGYQYLSELAQRPEYRVISETIATEMTRKWIQFNSKDGDDDKAEKIKQLEAEFKRLHVRDMFCRATEQDGFFGRGHIYIDTGDTDDRDELNKSIGDGWDKLSKAKVSPKHPITALRTIEAVWCYPTSYNSNDPLKDNWYRPDSWFVQAKTVHSSRLITFIGREVPDILKPTYSFGGLSLSQMAKPYVDNWLQTRQGVNDIISAFSVFVLGTNLAESLQADGQELFKRATLFNLLRTNKGLMLIDKESEEFQNVSASLAGLDALQAQSQEHMAAVSHIPLVKLLGIQPAGLNASSEGEIRSFYDYINSYQEHLFRDKLHRLLGLIMLSLWGEVDEDIDFKFEPLWSLDEKGLAEVEKLKAETDQILIDTGTISQEEARKRVAHDPDSGYSDIEVDELPDLEQEEEDGLKVKGAGGEGEGSADEAIFGKAA